MIPKIGCDPEVFLKDEGRNLISAYGVIPGTKKHPHKVIGGTVQVDGMALEFGIDPANNVKEFTTNIKTVMYELKNMIRPMDIDIVPTAHFGSEYINNQPEEARELGCEPDFNAYTGEENPRPNVEAPFRTASGHIHIGWTEDTDVNDPEHWEACRMLTKQLDVMLAVPSKLWDDDEHRRTLYGNLGAFRPKPYGMEYRVLSNSWLTNPALIDYIYYTTVYAFKMLIEGNRMYDSFDAKSSFDQLDPNYWWNAFSNYAYTRSDQYPLMSNFLEIATNKFRDKKKKLADDQKKMGAAALRPQDIPGFWDQWGKIKQVGQGEGVDLEFVGQNNQILDRQLIEGQKVMLIEDDRERVRRQQPLARWQEPRVMRRAR